MNHQKKILAIMSLMLVSLPFAASATLINADLDNVGDQLVVLDTDTNLEWALVTQTGNSVNNFLSNSVYAGKGFTVATGNDLLTFFTNSGAAGLSIGVYHKGPQYQTASNLMYSLMDVTAPYSAFGGNLWIHAFYDNGNGSFDTGRVGLPDANNFYSFMIGNNNLSNASASQVHSAYSVWAHRGATDVPAPTTAFLLLIGLAGLRLSRKA
jgi:hypothetical protein